MEILYGAYYIISEIETYVSIFLFYAFCTIL